TIRVEETTVWCSTRSLGKSSRKTSHHRGSRLKTWKPIELAKSTSKHRAAMKVRGQTFRPFLQGRSHTDQVVRSSHARKHKHLRAHFEHDRAEGGATKTIMFDICSSIFVQ
ncbi:unnamed protein product, partial [Ectocarpus sp. 13 AM-2016]